MGEIKSLIAENLRAICKKNGIKQKDIAKELNASTGSVANWLNGVNGIDIENLYKLCQYLGVTLNQVVGIEPVGADLSSSELHLVNVYRALNQTGRDKLTDYADDLTASGRYQKDTPSEKMA